MNYNEWYDKYVKSDPQTELSAKKFKNKYSDKKQYEKYRAVLGKNVPKSFAKFQDLKYNNTAEWTELKSDFRYKNLLNNREIFIKSDSVRSLPIELRANVIADFIDENGNVKQRRIYGVNKKPYKDIDTNDHKRPKYHPMGAHKHLFDYSLKNPHGKADYFTERELRQNADIIQKGVNYHP